MLLMSSLYRVLALVLVFQSSLFSRALSTFGCDLLFPCLTYFFLLNTLAELQLCNG